MVRTCRKTEKDAEHGSEWTPKDRKTKTEAERCYTKSYEGYIEKKHKPPENTENENLKGRPQIWKRLKKI